MIFYHSDCFPFVKRQKLWQSMDTARLAQLVRASRLHREGPGFESLSAHMVEPKVVYEDGDVLVIDKPAGLSVHGDGRSQSFTLADWLLKKYPELEKVGESQMINGIEVKRPGIVHRLDRETSGVMAVAKNEIAYGKLKKQFRLHQIKKKYLALLAGELKLRPGEMVGTINVPIGRSRQDARVRVAHPRAVGKQREAVTRYRPIRVLTDEDTGQTFTLVESYPETGRTHQLRAHFKYLNHPIVGDKLYAPNFPAPAPLHRVALHAVELTLHLPSGEEKTFSAELPADFRDALAHLQEM